MKHILLFLLVASFIQPLIAQTNNENYNLPKQFKIIPQPKNVEKLEGNGLIYGSLKKLEIKGEFKRPVMGVILNSLEESDCKEKGGVLTIKLDSSGVANGSTEGYILTIANGNVRIISSGKAGLFYGCQTLEQLLEDARDFNIEIPACKITDYPDYTYRAVHFDSKHHLDYMNYYYESIDRLSRYKINAITWEFEDKLRYQKQPLIGAPQAISIDQMAAITKYAKERNIEITPLVQGLGHATFILKHQEYEYLREIKNNRWAFCPLNEGTYQVLFDLYRDAIKATPGSKYFHIGGDEIGNIGLCERCKPTADEKGKFELNLYWMNRVCEFLEEQGRIPIFWDDMAFQYAKVWYTTREEKDSPELWKEGVKKLDSVINQFPKNSVFMHWNYSSCKQPGNDRAITWLTDNNLNTMISTAAQSGRAALFPFDDRTGKMSDRGITAIQSSIQLAYRKNIKGVLCSGWDDRSPHMETYWKGFIATAEYSWNTQGRILDEYERAYLQREYGPDVNYADLYLKLRDAAHFWETSLVRTGTRFDDKNALFELPHINHELTEEERDKHSPAVNYDNVVVEMPNLKNPGEWTMKYKERLDRAKKLVATYKNTSKKLISLYKESNRNRYHWELFSAINDFQITAPKFLLALEQCDVKNSSKREEGFKEVRRALGEFDVAWENLKNVYAETRFITYPDNYVVDRYFHFASQREDLTWMIQVEQQIRPIVDKWLNEYVQ